MEEIRRGLSADEPAETREQGEARLYYDGRARGDPGRSGAGAVLLQNNKASENNTRENTRTTIQRRVGPAELNHQYDCHSHASMHSSRRSFPTGTDGHDPPKDPDHEEQRPPHPYPDTCIPTHCTSPNNATDLRAPPPHSGPGDACRD
jgi:hypothetical protein